MNPAPDACGENKLRLDPVIEAIRRGDVVQALATIEAGADVNACDEGPEFLVQQDQGLGVIRRGRTALIMSSEYGYENLVNVLIRRGAKIDGKEKTKFPPLRRTALSYASEKGHLGVVRILVKAGAGLEEKDRHIRDETGGKTALCYACQSGHLRVAEFLIDSGANVNHKCTDGKTPLIIAVEANAVEIVKMLLAHNAEINICDNSGWCALHAAISTGSAEIVSVFLKAGADPNLGVTQRNVPLTTAVINNNLKMVELLLGYGANVNVQDALGMTPTMFASMFPDGVVLRQLLSKAPDLSLVDNRGRKAIDIARSEDALENVNALRVAGAI